MRAFGRIEKNPTLTLQERLLDVIIPVSAIVISFYGSLWELHREPTQDFAVKTFRIGSFTTAEANLPLMGWQNEREFHNRILPPGLLLSTPYFTRPTNEPGTDKIGNPSGGAVRNTLVFWLLITCCAAQSPVGDPVALLDELEWRSIGPAAMGGRVSGIEGVPGNPRLLYAAMGSGGLFKTTNGGVTWQAVFERPDTISIGDVAIDPKRPDIVWVGTGEANVRNSVSIGGGMYYSADGGQRWEHRGLEQTMTISRVALDPRDSQRVFVAAVGHPFGPNPERGVFFSPDAGRTWQKLLYIDPQTGASDLDIDPSNPDVVFAGMWQFDRKPWRYDSGGTSGGLYKSSDGGKTWRKITSGLPALLGRIGVKVAPSNPKIVYLVAESKEGALFRSDDGGESFTVVNNDRGLTTRGYYYCDLRVDPKDENRVYVLEGALMLSTDGGKAFSRIGGSVHGDLQALWIDPLDPARIWQGSDGGLASSWDAGKTWQHVSNISLGQFYHVYADRRKPFYFVSGGTQDNGTWMGPSQTREPAGIMNDEWRMVSPIVGFNTLSETEDPDVIISQTPGGALLRTDMRNRDQQSIGPQVRSNNGAGIARMKYRFAWDAPLVRSVYGRDTFYYGGNVIFQSSDKGATWEPISHDLTNADPEKWKPSGGPIFTDNSSSEVYGAVTHISESSVTRGVLWAGTDDGNLQVTTNGGGQWVNVISNFKGVPAHSPVSALEASHRNGNVVYAAFDRHMFDDMRPYLFRSTDGGKTWTKIIQGLPDNGFIWVVREDLKNPDVLYLGTEVGAFLSLDRGEHWVRFNLKNLPNVAVRDIFLQPDRNDVLLATHGRGLYILDDATPVQEVARLRSVTLLPIRPAFRYAVRATRAGGGDSEFAAPNPPYGATLDYYLPSKADEVRVDVQDASGKVIRSIAIPEWERGRGLHRTVWDLRTNPPAANDAGRGGRRGGGGDGEGREGGGRGGASRGAQVLPGVYTVKLTAGTASVEQNFTVEIDPELKSSLEDLRAQWTALQKLSEMIRGSGNMLREAARHGDSPTWESFRRSVSEAGLTQQLQSLFTLIDGANDAPTEAMRKLFDELAADYNRLSQEYRKLQ